GWTTEKYQGRVNTIASALGKVEPAPDIIIFQEVESLGILEAIASSLSGDTWSHFAGNPGAALGLGIISRYPLLESKIHSITTNGQTAPRPVLETRVQAGEGKLVIFACHWKSKIGSDEVTENVRRASARVILRRIRELQKESPELGVIIAGDLNENYDEFFRQGSAAISALLPDDPYCAQLTGAGTDAECQKDFIVISRNSPPEAVHFSKECIVLFSPWMRDIEDGSYYYKHEWETIDHFLISGQFFTNSGWDYEKAAVANYPPFSGTDGMPIPYNMRTGAGLSDHLPLTLTLKLKGAE
ncbi:MAG: endonuclease/exonuclease/phosphatase family protein, partial [Treponema sp.]|nr:endonuclease/exonuclease/phosphatase family protein [Treponema sp.]